MTFNVFRTLVLVLLALAPVVTEAQKKKSETAVVYRGNPASPISASVTVPPGKQHYFSSGTVAHLADSTVKPARSTLGVAQLVYPELLIEIEIVAVY